MGRTSTVDQLPTNIKLKLKTLIREGRQTQLDITEWLNGQGFNISKSALGRYSQRIVSEDSKKIIDKEYLITGSEVDLTSLFEELECIRVRESEILAMITNKIFSKPKKIPEYIAT